MVAADGRPGVIQGRDRRLAAARSAGTVVMVWPGPTPARGRPEDADPSHALCADVAAAAAGRSRGSQSLWTRALSPPAKDSDRGSACRRPGSRVGCRGRKGLHRYKIASVHDASNAGALASPG